MTSKETIAMPTQKNCPKCGAELPSDALGGLCPACMLKAGMGATASAPGPTYRSDWVPPLPEDMANLFPELDQIELIGRGGMGAVYKARQIALDRVIAIKILPQPLAEAAGFSDRFAREAQAMAKLNHRNIVTLHEFGQRQSMYYLIMEYIEGASLRHLIDTGGISPREALAIIPQICDALQFAHDRGVVHRDIKPENILLDRAGHVKIADFGLARLTSATGAQATQLVMGTPYYMAPEQMTTPYNVDHRADIYSLGVVFYQLLTGELPIGRFEPPSRRVALDVRLDEVVLRSLEREPDRRYQQASEVKTQVEHIATDPWPGQQPGVILGIVLTGRRNGQLKLKPLGVVRIMVTVISVYIVAFATMNLFVTVPRVPYELAALIFAAVGILFRALTTPVDRLVDLDANPPTYPRQSLLTGWRTLLAMANIRQDGQINWSRFALVAVYVFGVALLYVAAMQVVFGLLQRFPGPMGPLLTSFAMIAFMPMGYFLATRLWGLDIRPADNTPGAPSPA